MASKSKTRMFNGKKYTIALVSDSKRRAQIKAKAVRDAGGLARVTTQQKPGGFFANRYYVWTR